MICQDCSLCHYLNLICGESSHYIFIRDKIDKRLGAQHQEEKKKQPKIHSRMLLYKHETFRWTEGYETLCSRILRFMIIQDARQGERFLRTFIVSCHNKSDGFNCYRQKCILGTPSLTFGATPVINLAWLTCSWVARLIIAKDLISQKRESNISCSFTARNKACCVFWE